MGGRYSCMGSLLYMGNLAHSRLGAPKRDFLTEKCLTDGTVALVTGANAGIGFEITKGLSLAGARVHLVCRSEERGRAAIAEIRETDPEARLTLHVLDVSKPADVREFVGRFQEDEGRLNILVQNVAVMPNQRVVNDGLELAFSTNLLGFYLLGEGLLPLLEASSSPESPSRAINVVSGGMLTSRLDVSALNSCDEDQPYSGMYTYSQTHRARVVLTEHWAETSPEYVQINSCHPGWVDTPGLQQASDMKGFTKTMNKFGLLRTAKQGADSALWLAVSPDADFTGRFVYDRKPRSTDLPLSGTATSPESKRALLELCRRFARDDEAAVQME